jgi:hypothetical protein
LIPATTSAAPPCFHDQTDRDAISSLLLATASERAGLADIIDMLTLHPQARQKVVRLLGEIEAIEKR